MSPTPSRRGVSRRTMLAGAAALAGTALAGCSSGGRSPVTFYQSKREAIDYFRAIVSEVNGQQNHFRYIHDVATNIQASFVRRNPPDIACQNFNLEMTRFVERGALTDLADLPAADEVREDVLDLAAWYPTYEGRISVIPYSIAACSVIYNKRLFDDVGAEVPTTWSEFVEVCERLQAADILPIYATYVDPWTITQGFLDYSAGGMMDVRGFYERMNEIGEDVGPDSEVSFSKDMLGPVQRMIELTQFVNSDAPSRAYGDGNTAMAQGQAAMYFQGPWALAEIDAAGSEEPLGTFPFPATEDPEDLKIRVGVDLALWIPEDADQKDGARELLEHLMLPEVQHPYNDALLAFSTTNDAPRASDDRIAPMQEYYDEGKYAMGVSQFIPLTIPSANYFQSIALGDDPEPILARLDSDWARLAYRGE